MNTAMMTAEPLSMTPAAYPPRRLSVAPMMERTDRHCRYVLRLLAPHTWLYTEMVTAAALEHGDRARLLRYDAREHPVALQLGGSDPAMLARAARHGEAAGYDEINLNVGCPSDRVQAGCFGAALMREPELVGRAVTAMRDAVGIPVTVKTRLGVDEHDSYAFLCELVGAVAEAGCRTLIVHARKAWLKGLSPKENREVPPLDYARVRRLKSDFAELEIILNGGLADFDTALGELAAVDGVMLGRAAYADPMLLARLDAAIYGGEPPAVPDVLERYTPYVEREVRAGTRLHAITRHLMGLFASRRGGRAWRRALVEWPQRSANDAEAALRAWRELVTMAADIDAASRDAA